MHSSKKENEEIFDYIYDNPKERNSVEAMFQSTMKY